MERGRKDLEPGIRGGPLEVLHLSLSFLEATTKIKTCTGVSLAVETEDDILTVQGILGPASCDLNSELCKAHTPLIFLGLANGEGRKCLKEVAEMYTHFHLASA